MKTAPKIERTKKNRMAGRKRKDQGLTKDQGQDQGLAQKTRDKTRDYICGVLYSSKTSFCLSFSTK
jgi:hypothetical protein